MPTFRNCITPEDGWGLIHHFLGNRLNLIPLKSADEKNEIEEERKYKHTRDIDDIWAGLIGRLYMISCRMISNDHLEDAKKMQQIINMLVELDLTNDEVCRSIHNKENEVNPLMISFNATLAKYKAEHKDVE